MDLLNRFIEYRIKTNPGMRAGLFEGFHTLLTNAFDRGENGDLGIMHGERLLSFTVDDLMAQLILWWPAREAAVYDAFPGCIGVEAFVATDAIPFRQKVAAVRRYLDTLNHAGREPLYLLLPACSTAVFIPKKMRRKMRTIITLMNTFGVK